MPTTTEWIRARLDELKPELDAKRREMAVLTKECDALQTALTALAGPSKPPERRPAVNGYTHRDYPAIAEWVIARFAEGSYTSQAAAAEFGTNPGNWYSILHRLRKDGLVTDELIAARRALAGEAA